MGVQMLQYIFIRGTRSNYYEKFICKKYLYFLLIKIKLLLYKRARRTPPGGAGLINGTYQFLKEIFSECSYLIFKIICSAC